MYTIEEIREVLDSDRGRLSQALSMLESFALHYGYTQFAEWARMERCGYPDSADLPDYRQKVTVLALGRRVVIRYAFCPGVETLESYKTSGADIIIGPGNPLVGAGKVHIESATIDVMMTAIRHEARKRLRDIYTKHYLSTGLVYVYLMLIGLINSSLLISYQIHVAKWIAIKCPLVLSVALCGQVIPSENFTVDVIRVVAFCLLISTTLPFIVKLRLRPMIETFIGLVFIAGSILWSSFLSETKLSTWANLLEVSGAAILIFMVSWKRKASPDAN